jgi:nitrogen-specific signal transduction histidine kinase
VEHVGSIGELKASIAHEVNQPLSGIITNASTCVRMLGADPPNVEGARETARRTIRDGNRASDVITRLRALFTKKDASFEAVDLNEAAREVVALSVSELQRSGTVLRQELADGLPPAVGDRVQLQQVILNLILNASDAMREIDDRPRTLSLPPLGTARAGSVCRYATPASALIPGTSTNSSTPFTRPRVTAWASACRSAGRSSRAIKAVWASANDGPGATFSFSIPCRA